MPRRGARGAAPVAAPVDDAHFEQLNDDEEDDEEEVDWSELMDTTREEMFVNYPHELVIINLRQLELSSVVTTLLICFNVRIVWAHPTFDLPTLCMDHVLLGLCYIRFAVYCARVFSWVTLHALWSAARNQPTPPLMRAGMDRAVAYRSQQPGDWLLTNLYRSNLCLVPCLTYYGPQTALSVNLWYHWRWCMGWYVASLILAPIMLYVLSSSSLVDRGMTSACLEANTKISAFDPSKPWSAFGDPQCGICLVEYEKGDPIRLMPCDHHFHTKCVDGWLKKYTNHCPFCRAPLEPASTKED